MASVRRDTRVILLSYPGDPESDLFNASARDNCCQPFLMLRAELAKRGFVIEQVSDQPLRQCACIVYWNVNNLRLSGGLRGVARRLRSDTRGAARDLISEARRQGLTERLALVLWEPPSVCPENWDLKTHDHFPRILTWNDELVDGVRYHKFRPPVPSSFPVVPARPFESKKLLTMIAMNKVSSYPSELYSARERSITYFETHHPADFDLYGIGWDDSPQVPSGTGSTRSGHRASQRHPSYREPVANKWNVFPIYRFALCYENVFDQSGWVTEKLFDCMRADCVPVYWGAPNVDEYVDSRAYIDRRRFQSDSELASYLAGMSEARYEEYRTAVRQYLQSEAFHLFESPAFVVSMLRGLGLC
jgi:hypothetical protein